MEQGGGWSTSLWPNDSCPLRVVICLRCLRLVKVVWPAVALLNENRHKNKKKKQKEEKKKQTEDSGRSPGGR